MNADTRSQKWALLSEKTKSCDKFWFNQKGYSLFQSKAWFYLRSSACSAVQLPFLG